MKYQYDIFSVIHNFVNFHIMRNTTSTTSNLLWCYVATGSIQKESVQIYYSPKSWIPLLYFKLRFKVVFFPKECE